MPTDPPPDSLDPVPQALPDRPRPEQDRPPTTINVAVNVHHMEHGTITGAVISAPYATTVYINQSTPAPLRDPAALAAAHAQLAHALTSNDIPTPAPLPPHSRMGLPPNPQFVGRADDLRAIARALQGDRTPAVGPLAAITGLGGIGKTQLAVEFVHRYGPSFAGGVFWLNFATAADVPSEVAACGVALDLPKFAKLKLDDQVAHVRQVWQEPVPRLLVFDTCEDEALLQQWRPASGGARVLVTSRRASWDELPEVITLALDVLARPDSIALLRAFRPDLAADDADLHAIAEALGDLPLALHMAGSFLKRYRRETAPADYLAELRAAVLDHESLQDVELTVSPTKHALHVAQTFNVSLARLRPYDPTDTQARALLARAALLAPGVPIPHDLLLATLDRPDAAAKRLASRALQRLIDLGLLDALGEGDLRLHRLLAAFARTHVADEAARPAVEQVLTDESYRLNSAGDPRPMRTLLPHLRAVTDAALAREDDAAATLCSNLGALLRILGDLAQARQSYERALAITERMLGPHHPDTSTDLNNLGIVLQEQGDLAGARPYLERALAIRKRTLDSDHPAIATSLNNLGLLLRELGDLADARPYLEHALAIREQVLEPEHPVTAQSLNNLGLLLQELGDLADARAYYERALAIQERGLGADHPDIAASLNNLGLLLQNMGNLAGAKPYLARALAIREQVLGANHSDTALSLNNLGLLLQKMGKLAEASALHERALAIQEWVLGTNHPNTALSLNNLGLLLQAQGELADARAHYERALAIQERVLGAKHPDTALSLNNLGSLLQDMGQLAEARPYLERALAIREQVLGTNHADTAQSLNNLGMLLYTQGDLAGARPYYERALAIQERVLGSNHPSTALSLNNLGMLLYTQGDLAGARPYYERALAIQERVLGIDHPDTALSLNNLGGLLYAQGNLAGARPLFERALAIAERTLGHEHPTAQQFRANLAALDVPPETHIEQIAAIRAQAEAAIARVLDKGSAEQRATLAARLEEVAQQVAEGEAEGSPYLDLARDLRAMAARLRAGP